MQQMSWREMLDDARDSGHAHAFAELDALLAQARAEMTRNLTVLIDEKRDFETAGQRVREWMFLEKMAQAIDRDRPPDQ
jgi:molecular chaperone HscB